jgi:thiol-disulfide isomerase/thioredoxin
METSRNRNSLFALGLTAAVAAAALVAVRVSTNANAADKVKTAASAVAKPATKSVAKTTPVKAVETIAYNVKEPYPAAELVGLQNWVNSNPQTIAGLKGKVVIVNFWTFGCINCQNTIPHVKEYYEKFHDKGLEIIAVHTPEFGSERDANNVKKAVEREGIVYPVAQDNDSKTWGAYHNRFWPAFFFIDKKGMVRHTHFGEGRYAQNMQVIQQLLNEA